FLYLPKSNINNKRRAPEQLCLKRRNVKKNEAVKKNEEASHPTTVKKRRVFQPDTDFEEDIFLVDQVVEGIGNIDIGSCSMYSANIHPQINLRFATEADVKGDGFCGFRCLAFEIYGDQVLFWKVKITMRDVLLQNVEFYSHNFSDYIAYDRLKKVVCFGIEEIIESNSGQKDIAAPLQYWFYSPGCTQLAADTFRRLVATYTDVVVEKDEDPVIFFPFLYTNYYHVTNEGSEAYSPAPVVLHNIAGNHWITFKMKKSVKMLWPRPHSRFWKHMCEKMRKDPNFKRSLWYTILHFVPKPKFTPARVEDAIDLEAPSNKSTSF
ncbi:hypothetical protein BD770DRAFT_457522, partial [Pilaira anomala]